MIFKILAMQLLITRSGQNKYAPATWNYSLTEFVGFLIHIYRVAQKSKPLANDQNIFHEHIKACQ